MGADLETALGILAAALLADRLLGEYPTPLHPVVWVGQTVSALLRVAPGRGWWRQVLFGAALALGLSSLAGALTWRGLRLVAGWQVFEVLLGTFLFKATFAVRALDEAAGRVQRTVQDGDLGKAREALRSLCSRDPSQLGPDALLAGTIQSLAENASDSFVAPFFYYALFGVPGACVYRVINTLDAMVGYRDKYEALGKVSARLDDVVNWVPARLTAGLLLLAGRLAGKDAAGGWRILRRDGANTPSPNGGRPMAVMAGLLGVRLEKPGVYVLGDAQRPLTPVMVFEARRLVAGVSWWAAGLCALGVLARHGWPDVLK